MTESHPPDRHPLLPGVRSTEVWNPDWPRVLHDKQITGFSPLTCGMVSAPSVWSTVEVGGQLSWARVVPRPAGTRSGDASGAEPMILVDDGRLRAVTPEGQGLWESPVCGELLFAGDLCNPGSAPPPDLSSLSASHASPMPATHLLIGRAHQLFLVDGANGATLWQHAFDPPHVRVRASVGRVLPARSGLQVAVFLAYGERGCLLDFSGGVKPEWVWQRQVVVDGEWPERADHGCGIELDLSVPDEPLIWNVRHHRCRALCARTGDMVSSLVYEIGAGQRRNYGPWGLGTGRDGQAYICVVSERVQTHVHGLRLARSGCSDLAWQRYYGEVYVVPGVSVERAALADVDGDGATEVAYTARDPERGFRSFVRVRRVDTGEIALERADARCLGALPGLGPSGEWGLVVEEDDPAGHGVVRLAWLEATGQCGSAPLPRGWRPWGTPAAGAYPPGELLLRRSGDDAPGPVARCGWTGGEFGLLEDQSGPNLAAGPLRLFVPGGARGGPAPIPSSGQIPGRAPAPVPAPGGTRVSAPRPELFIAEEEGQVCARSWDGHASWSLPLSGGPPALVSAADLNGEGRAEVVAAAPGDRVLVWGFGSTGDVDEIAEFPYSAPRGRLGPLLYDLEGTGQLCLVAPAHTAAGQPLVRAWRPDGSLAWETVLPVPASAGASVIAWNAGDFLGPRRAAVAASVTDPPRTVEGTFLLDGRDGAVVWHRERLKDGAAIRGFYPAGLPTAVDVDGDGAEEIGIDCLSYMGYVRGRDGSFAIRHHSPNIRPENCLYAAQLYNSFCPLYRTEQDEAPHWFSPLGFGTFGLMHPDPTTGIWREEVGYDVPPRAGLVDVDGDGRLEVGYALLNHCTFVCRDLWTGDEKWRLDLPEPPDSPVLAADVDGDGRGEFLVGRWCLGTDDGGRGQVRWEAPVSMGWAAIADVDGDGLGEIICAGPGRVYVLKAAT